MKLSPNPDEAAICSVSTSFERTHRPAASVLTEEGTVLSGSRWVRMTRASG